MSSDTLVAALGKQTKLREEKLGEHLADRGVVSPDDLKSALRLQEDRPAAKLGELLLEAALITAGQLADAVNIQARNRRRGIGEILVEMGVVTTRQVHMALADKLGIPFVNVREFQVEPTALEALSADIAARIERCRCCKWETHW